MQQKIPTRKRGLSSRAIARSSTALFLAVVGMALVLHPSTVAGAPAGEPKLKQQKTLLNLPDGGHVEVQRRFVEDGIAIVEDGIPVENTFAFFMSETFMPETTSFSPGECVPAEESRFALQQPLMRTYFEVGKLTFAGGPEGVELEARPNVRDREGREHDIAYFNEEVRTEFQYTSPGTEYDIQFSGSDDFPETKFRKALYLPVDYVELEPVRPPVGPILIPMGQDLVVKWIPGDNGDKAGEHHYHWIDFYNSEEGHMTWICVHEDDGEYIVPKEIVDNSPSVGFFLSGTVNVRMVELNDGTGKIKKRRLDFVGVNMFGHSYVLVE